MALLARSSAVALLALFVLGSPRASRACFCLFPRAPLAAMNVSDVVLYGRTIAAVQEDGRIVTPTDGSPGLRSDRVLVEVRAVWRGPHCEEVEIRDVGFFNCSRSFEIPRDVLIFAGQGSSGNLSTMHACGQVRDLPFDEAMLSLGAPEWRPPDGGDVLPSETSLQPIAIDGD